MTRHKERTLENLYNVTPVLPQPEACDFFSVLCYFCQFRVELICAIFVC